MNPPLTGHNVIEVSLPILTVSEANGVKKPYIRKGKTVYKNEHWTDKHRRHKAQKRAVYMMLQPLRDKITLPCLIEFTRYAPCKLDRHDNLPMAFKWILDACCAIITGDHRPGRADDNEAISVAYKQEQSKEYSIKIRIENQ